MKFGRLFSTVVLEIAVAGCATAYHPMGYTGGFSETVLAPDTFKIRFAGNAFTSSEKVSDFALLRAAEKSQELGCNYFGVMSEADGASVEAVTLSSLGWGRHGAWGFSNSMPVVKPDTALLVKCTREQPPGADLFDAHFIAQSIRAKYDFRPHASSVPMPSARSGTVSGDRPEQAAARFVASAPGGVPISSTAPAAVAVAGGLPMTTALQAYTRMVASAQQVATQIGCGSVVATGPTHFQARCESYDVVIECRADGCQPLHTINHP
ncbi:CC0125/CC1285 family lipoprotein [Frateuria aurantia]